MVYLGLPIKTGDFPWRTVSHNQMVNHPVIYWGTQDGPSMSGWVLSSGDTVFGPVFLAQVRWNFRGFFWRNGQNGWTFWNQFVINVVDLLSMFFWMTLGKFQLNCDESWRYRARCWKKILQILGQTDKPWNSDPSASSHVAAPSAEHLAGVLMPHEAAV